MSSQLASRLRRAAMHQHHKGCPSSRVAGVSTMSYKRFTPTGRTVPAQCLFTTQLPAHQVLYSS
jgi:hypothetical protein